MSPKEVVEQARRFANHPSLETWSSLFGARTVATPTGTPEMLGVRRAADWFQAALSDISHDRQTAQQIESWRRMAREVVPVPDYRIEGQHVRMAIFWSAPRELLEYKIDPDWLFVTENPDALLATAIMWLLDPEQPFTNLRECGRGQHCEVERFFFRNRLQREYCCTDHTKQSNKATSTERSRDRYARNKAIEQLKRVHPNSARDLVWAVKAPGLSKQQLIDLALAEHKRLKGARAPKKTSGAAAKDK